MVEDGRTCHSLFTQPQLHSWETEIGSNWSCSQPGPNLIVDPAQYTYVPQVDVYVHNMSRAKDSYILNLYGVTRII